MSSTSDKIGADQIIDPAAFPTLYENVEKLIELLDKSQVKIKENLIAMRSILAQGLTNPETVAELQKANAKIKDQNELLVKLSTTHKALTIEQAKVRVSLQNQNKETKEAAKAMMGLTTEYQKQSKTLIDLRKAAQAVLLSNKENTIEGKAIIAQYTEMDLKLKKVDATLGQHNRVIGDYGRHVIEAAKGVGGLTGLFATLGKALGFETESLEELVRIGRESIKVSREMLNIRHGEIEAAKDFGEVQEANVELTELQNSAYEQNAAAQLEAAAATEAETAAQEELNVAFMANPIVLVIAGIAALAAGLGLLLSETEDNVDQLKAFNKAMDDELKAIDTNLFEIQKLSIEYDVLSGKIDKYEGKRRESALDVNKELAEADKKFLEQKATMYEEFQKTQGGVLNSVLGVMGTATESSVHAANLYYKELQTLEMTHNTEILTIKTKGAAAQTNATQEQTNEENKEHDDLLKKRLDAEKKYEDEMRKFRDEMIKLEHDQLHEKAVFEEEERERKAKEDADALEKQQIGEFKFNEEKIAREKREQLERDALEAKREEDAKKARIKEAQDATDFADRLYKIEKDHQEKMNAAKIADIDYNLEKNKTAIEMQLELAAAGKANTLDYELKKQDELEKARVKELQAQKKRAKEQEAIELSLAFLKAYEKNMETMKPGQALSMAASETLAAKLLGASLAGSAEKGVESTGPENGPGLDGRGGRLWMLHPEEGVANKKANKKYKGAIGAMNEGKLEDWAMKNIMLSQYNSATSLADVNKAIQVNDALSEMMLQKLDDIKQTIKDKPEYKQTLTPLGDLINEKFEKGMRNVTIKQTFIK